MKSNCWKGNELLRIILAVRASIMASAGASLNCGVSTAFYLKSAFPPRLSGSISDLSSSLAMFSRAHLPSSTVQRGGMKAAEPRVSHGDREGGTAPPPGLGRGVWSILVEPRASLWNPEHP